MPEMKEKTVSTSCPECEIGPFTRNHYFTGKLLVERDFRQEQAYYKDKLRLHEQRLHGDGVVCGLKGKQHENPACRDRFVCIEPGLAIDCCGHDILVAEQDCVDLTQIESVKTLLAQKDGKPHTLQICIHYKECPSEPIPVLYDDCGCDDTQCAPNRILESYEVDVVVDPQIVAASPDSPTLDWKNSINVAHALAVAYHDATRKLYVLTDDPQGFVYQISTDNYAVLSSHALSAQGLTLAVSSDGDRVYVVAQGTKAADPRQLHVLDATQPGLPLIQKKPIDINNSGNSGVVLRVLPSPDDRLLALITATGDLLRWETDIDTKSSPADPKKITNLGANQNCLVLSSDGARAYVGGTGNKIQVLALASPPATSINVLPAGATPAALAIVQSTSGDLLAVADQGKSKLYLVNPSTPALVGTVSLDHPPIAVAVAPDSHWAYVVEQDAGKSYLEPVDMVSLQLGNPVVPGNALDLGADSGTPVITSSGHTLYVPYTGDLANAADGGVAIVHIGETDCCQQIWKSLDGCPSCDTADCLVLATIKNYVAGESFQDQTDPPADPIQDGKDHISRIDNREGRRLLPSTSTLAEMIECLCAAGTGGKGAKGDPGLPGPPGKDGKDGKDGINGKDGKDGTNGTNGKDGKDGKDGTNGKDGKDGQGLEQGLTRIAALSWIHNDPNGFSLLDLNPGGAAPVKGIVISFTGPIIFSPQADVPRGPGKDKVSYTIDADHVFQVLVEEPGQQSSFLLCRCPAKGSVVAAEVTSFDPNNSALITGAKVIASPAPMAIAFVFSKDMLPLGNSREFWIKLHCDFVIDKNGKAIDGAFLRMQLPTGDHLGAFPNPPSANPFGIQGGLFESWFRLEG